MPALTMHRLAVAAVALLYVLHQDFWFWREARPLVFGFLPIGLFYHAAFTLASSAVLWLLVSSPGRASRRDLRVSPQRRSGAENA